MIRKGQTIKPRNYRRTNDALRDRIREALPKVVDVVLAAALNGDMAACKLLLAKALPDLKPEAERHPVPGLDGRDPRTALVELLAEGELEPGAALTIIKALSAPKTPGYPRTRAESAAGLCDIDLTG